MLPLCKQLSKYIAKQLLHLVTLNEANPWIDTDYT
jgi:hypothetical protein